MTSDTSSPTLVLDYELMENYVLASPLVAFSELAAATDQNGLAEAFLIGGANSSVVNHVYQDSTSDTGWGYYGLPATPDGNPITSIAAATIVGAEGYRVIAVATSGPNVYVIQEIAPWSRNWNSWSPSLSQVNSRVVLRICNGTLLLGLVSQYAVYGSVTSWQVCSGPLNFGVYPPWTGDTSFYTDLPICDFIYNSGFSQNFVTGCVSPTLSLFPVTSFSQWIWSTSGSSKYGNNNDTVSFYRPQPSEPTAVLLSDLAIPGVESQYVPANTPPYSVLCAGSIEDESGSSGSPILQPTGGVTHTWDDHGTHTTLSATLWQPDPVPPNYVTSAEAKNHTTSPATCWFMNPGIHGNPHFEDGTISLWGTQIDVSLIRDDLMSPPINLQSTPVFTTTDEPSKHKLSLFAFQSPADFSIPNCFAIMNDNFKSNNPAPVTAPFPSAAITRLSGVLVQSAIGSGGTQGFGCTGGTSFSNWCQVSKADGTAYSFAVDYAAGNLWFVNSLDSGGQWQNLSDLQNLSAPLAFVPCALGGTTFAGMQAGDGTVQIFAIGTDNGLYWISETGVGTGVFYDPVPAVGAGITAFGLVPLPPDTTEPRLFAISNDASPVLFYISLAGNEFTQSTVQLQVPGSQQQLQQISSYTVDAHLKDSTGALIGNAQVTVTSTQPCTAIVNGSAARLMPGVVNKFLTNASGGLHMIIPTADISAPTLTFALPDGTQLGSPVALNSKVFSNLSAMTASQFAAATDANGNLLFPDPTTSSSLQQAVTGLCVWALSANSQASASQGSSRAWEISFDGLGHAKFTTLAGAASLSGYESSGQLPGSAGSLFQAGWDDVRNLFNHAENKVKSVAATPQANGTYQIVINFTINTATQQFTYNLDAVNNPNLANQVLDIATALMVQAAATVTQITQWLSKLFNWPQISLTQQAVEYVIGTCFSLLEQSAGDIQTIFDNQFTSGVFSTSGKDLATAISSLSQMTLQTVDAFVPVQAVANLTLPRVEGSFFSAHLRDFCESGLADPGETTLTPGLAVLLSNIQQFGANVNGNSTVQSQITALSTPLTSDQQLQQTVTTASSAMISVVNSLISLVQQAVDGVFSLAASDITALQNLLQNTTIYVPWVSELYQLRFGQSMTVLGLMSAAIAIPAEMAFETLTGRAPFAGNTDLSDFEAGFTVTSLQAIWGLAQSGWQQEVSANSLARLEDAVNLLSIGALFARVFIDQLLDAIAGGQLEMQNFGSFFLSVSDIASSLALFASSASGQIVLMVQNPSYTPNIITTVALASVGAHWAIDTLFTCAPGVSETLRLDGDAGICMDMALSLASTSLYTLVDGLDYGSNFNAGNPPIALGSDVLSALAAVGHIGLVSAVVDTSDTGSVPLVLLMDYISDQYSLWTTVQATYQPSTAMAQSA